MKTVRALSVLLVVALLGTCATLPPPEKGNKTLLVIVVKTATPGTYGLAYDFGLKESDQRLAVNPKNGIVYFDKLPPGTYTIDRVYIMLGPGAAGGVMIGGPVMNQISPVSFKLTEGLITILPGTVLVSQETMANRTTQGWRWVPTNREEALAELAKYDNFSRWRVAQ